MTTYRCDQCDMEMDAPDGLSPEQWPHLDCDYGSEGMMVRLDAPPTPEEQRAREVAAHDERALAIHQRLMRHLDQRIRESDLTLSDLDGISAALFENDPNVFATHLRAFVTMMRPFIGSFAGEPLRTAYATTELPVASSVRAEIIPGRRSEPALPGDSEQVDRMRARLSEPVPGGLVTRDDSMRPTGPPEGQGVNEAPQFEPTRATLHEVGPGAQVRNVDTPTVRARRDGRTPLRNFNFAEGETVYEPDTPTAPDPSKAKRKILL